MKKFIPFILIFSLLVCFIPSYNFVVYASDSVSDDDVNGGGGGHSRNNHYTGLLGYINQFLLDNGYVINDENVITFNVIDSILEDNFGVDLDDYVSIYDKNNRSDLPMIYDYFSENNTNFDFDTFADDLSNYSLTYAKDNLSYYIYDFININDFFSYYNFSNYSIVHSNLSTFKTALESFCSDSDFVYFLSSKSRSGMNYLYDSTFVKIPRSFFDDGYLVLSYGAFSNITNYRFQSFRITADGPSVPSNVNVNGYLSLYDGFSYVSSFDGLEIYDIISKNGGNDFASFSRFLGSLSSNPFRIGLIQSSQGWFSNSSFVGTAFIYSGESFSVPVFRSTNLISDFTSGNADVYKVNSNIDLGQYGEDIDYSKLYDIIGSAIRGSDGNVIQAINYAVDNYLQQQIDLLHDINNALNDGTGQSWLRRIYGLLDFNFPLILQSFEDLQQAIQNISINGGGSDLSHINRVLDEINDKLGFMIEEPLTDADVQDMEDLKNLAQQKFPFCVFSDIVAISVILNQTPEQPHWQIPLKLPGSASANNIEVDLSWYENVRDLVQGVFIFIFIVGLLALSVKIFSALKS